MGVAAISIIGSSLGLAGIAAASGSTVTPVAGATTPAWVNGMTVKIQYPQNFFCDTSVASGASSGCEVGQDSNRGPVANADRSVLYVLVPLFANPSPAPMCAVASCPNHPLNIDLSRIAGALGAAPDQVGPALLMEADGSGARMTPCYTTSWDLTIAARGPTWAHTRQPDRIPDQRPG